MVRFNSLACFLLLASFIGISLGQRFGLLGKYDVIHKRLEEYIAKHHLSHMVKTETQWFEQKLDHFNPANTETWKQQYAVNMENYRDNGVVFLDIEGEWPMSTAALTFSAMADFGRKFGAAMFVVEHRFYGSSKPKPDLSIESMKYLSSEQALADLAYFITKINAEHGFSNPKWIVFGGSYAGSLAVWLRYKYPHLVYAAVSSSGPLVAKVDFPEYFETVAKSIATESQECVDVIKAVSNELSKGVADVVKRGEYREIFRLCDPLEDDERDMASFFDGLNNGFAIAVQYNYGMDHICEILTDKEIKCPLKRYAEAFRYMHLQYNEECFNHTYNDMIKEFKDTSIPQDMSIMRQWFYQTCTEFGFYSTSSREGDTFGDKVPVKFFTDMCADIYGPKFNEAFINRSIEETNVYYGARSLPVERVVFVHGSLDPWSSIGITSNPPKGSYVIVINGASHCEDMGPEFPDDAPQMKDAKQKISELIGDWLSGKKQSTRNKSVFRF